MKLGRLLDWWALKNYETTRKMVNEVVRRLVWITYKEKVDDAGKLSPQIEALYDKCDNVHEFEFILQAQLVAAREKEVKRYRPQLFFPDDFNENIQKYANRVDHFWRDPQNRFETSLFGVFHPIESVVIADFLAKCVKWSGETPRPNWFETLMWHYPDQDKRWCAVCCDEEHRALIDDEQNISRWRQGKAILYGKKEYKEALKEIQRARIIALGLEAAKLHPDAENIPIDTSNVDFVTQVGLAIHEIYKDDPKAHKQCSMAEE